MHAPANPSTSGVIPNPFAKPKTNRETYEFLWKQVLRLATYTIIAAVGLVFGFIIFKGLPVIMPVIKTHAVWLGPVPLPYATLDTSAPVINTDFLTKLPETLHVLEDKQGNKYETDPRAPTSSRPSWGTTFALKRPSPIPVGASWVPSSAPRCWCWSA